MDLVCADAASKKALELLDHVQNDLLRRRDARVRVGQWTGTAAEQAMNAAVGSLVEPITTADRTAFLSQILGQGVLPATTPWKDLRLVVALTKLKHRAPGVGNFSISPAGVHTVYVLADAGMGKPDAICSIDVQAMCHACLAADRVV